MTSSAKRRRKPNDASLHQVGCESDTSLLTHFHLELKWFDVSPDFEHSRSLERELPVRYLLPRPKCAN